MSTEISLPSAQDNNPGAREENNEWRKILIALLFLLFSFGFIFYSSQTALLLINRDQLDASMKSLLTADYGSDSLLALAPLSGEIAAEAARDEASLTRRQGPIGQGISIAVLPNPLIPPTFTPSPTPTLIPALPLPPTAASPESTASASPPPPTSTPAPPSSPTSLPPSPTSGPASPTPATPTVSPPTTPSPTSPPASSSTPTSEPTSDPDPTSEPTSTPVPPRVAFSTDTFSVNEGDGVATITVTLNRASAQTVSVDYATNNLTATAGQDYTAVADTLTFGPGQISQTFVVPITDDAQDEIDEAIVLSLGNPVNAVLGTPGSALLTITDDDPPTVQFVAAAYPINEGGGSATITVSLSTPSALTVTVPYSSTDLTATAGLDYTAASGTLTFAPGQTTRNFAVSITDDLLDEPDEETAILTLGIPTNGTLGTPSSAFLRITDNDAPPTVQFDRADYAVAEDAGIATITVTLSMTSALAVTVDYGATDGTATDGQDYSAVSDTLSFAPFETSQTFTVPVLEDGHFEADETVNLTLSNPAGASPGTPFAATLTIQDNEQPAFQFSAGDYVVAEDGGQATITVTLNVPSELPVSVTYSSADGTATAGQDYTPVGGTLNFAPLEINQVFIVPISEDTEVEGNEDIRLSLSNPFPNNVLLGTPPTATLTIEDNDRYPVVEFSSATYGVVENAGQATITVTLDLLPASPVTVNYRSSNGTATAPTDYMVVSDTLTFVPPQVSQTFTVPIVDDGIGEPSEDLLLTLDSPVRATLGATSTAILTIEDDDPPAVQFSALDYTVTEDVVQATIGVTLFPASTLTVTVPYSSTDLTATAGLDYMAVNGILTIAPGQISQSFPVTIINDTLDEVDLETLQLELGTPTNAVRGTPYTATLIIEDDDAPPTVRFSNPTYSVAENGGQATIAVELSAQSALTVTVAYSTTPDGTATPGVDYTPANGIVTFGPLDTSQTFLVTILDDSIPEFDESINLALANPNQAVLGTPNTATLAIVDNDRSGGSTCGAIYPTGEPNVGLPDGVAATVACDGAIIIDLQSMPVTVTGPADTGYDLVYYELLGTFPPLPPPGMIYLDLVTISIGQVPTSTNEADWYDVFVWGDAISDTNTNLMRSSPVYTDTGIASDNQVIESPPLVGPDPYFTGIQIDVDNSPVETPPVGSYRYVRISSPSAADQNDDGPDIDALQVFPFP